MTERVLYSIPADTSFVDAFAQGVLDRHGDNPLTLGAVQILLPTRRAVRALRDAFLRLTDGRPMILPGMRPIGDIDEDEAELLASEREAAGVGHSSAAVAGMLDLPMPIPEVRRVALLARIIARRGGEAADLPQALRLARELARLIDQVSTEGLDFGRLAGIVPDDLSVHWQETLAFLEIVTREWPHILEEQDAIDPGARRDRLIRAQADIWTTSPPGTPVYAAGTTGSIPATRALLKAVLGLPQGVIVLPGLDREIDDDTWRHVRHDETHPQHGLALLLEELEVPRGSVRLWPACEKRRGNVARGRLLAEVMRPAPITDGWAAAPALPHEALDGLLRIDCATPQEEAGVIALLMRESLETEKVTAALVTPDRDLALRVGAALRRWDLDVDDSAGVPLARTPPGAFLRLVARLLASDAAPLDLLAVLKHPLCSGGEEPSAFRRKARLLETAVLRGPRPKPGLRSLHTMLREKESSLADWLAPIAERAERFSEILEVREVDFSSLFREHVAIAEFLASTASASGAATPGGLWAGDAGEAAAEFVEDLIANLGDLPLSKPRQYAALLDEFMDGRVVRPRFGRHPRLAIWGPLEARLQHADLFILGGLNEASWPPDVSPDPWMSRPMRAQFGLPSLERRIGLAAHDFQQAAAAPRVVLTRSERAGGAPTIPSRWLLRLDTVLAASGLSTADMKSAEVQGWYRALDRPESVRSCDPPTPRPPVTARPRRLSVTAIETWMKDPYSIYARHVLKLKPLDPLDADPGAAERGTIVHEALERFVRENPDDLPTDAERRLREIGADVFRPFLDRPGVWAFWWPRFLGIAAWFVDWERKRRASVRPIAVEARGELTIAAPEGPFLLTAVADRIDRLEDGSLSIIDYKTGYPPSQKQVESGISPQLPLEAAMAAAGAFEAVERTSVSELAYVRLSGPAKKNEYKPMKLDPRTSGEEALDGLAAMIAAYDKASTPYLSKPRPDLPLSFSDYDHLARVKEWSIGGGEDET